MASASANTRAQAARVIAAVFGGRSLDDALAQADSAGLSAQNQSLLRALAYGVVRERLLLDALLKPLLQKPLSDHEVHALLLCGLHQLRAMRMPAFAAVDETVNATEVLNKPWARGFANAVLRRYQRETNALETAVLADPINRYSHPIWMVKELQKDWPQGWRPLLEANQVQGPMTLRVNRKRSTVAEFRAQLSAAGIKSATVPHAPDAVTLDDAQAVDKIPGFAEGLCSVQDAAAQLAAPLLDVQPGQRVLDACAAPGGKTAHILEMADVQLLALDVDAQRAQRINENLKRLGLTAEVKTGDAAGAKHWWDGQPYDRILLDAPCSGTGVIRRHPDIKWLRRFDDIPRFAGTQLNFLTALWPLLKPGGVLLYATCSTLRAEGSDVIARFLTATRNASERPITAEWGEAEKHGRRLAPSGTFDGFYYAQLVKNA